MICKNLSVPNVYVTYHETAVAIYVTRWFFCISKWLVVGMSMYNRTSKSYTKKKKKNTTCSGGLLDRADTFVILSMLSKIHNRPCPWSQLFNNLFKRTLHQNAKILRGTQTVRGINDLHTAEYYFENGIQHVFSHWNETDIKDHNL